MKKLLVTTIAILTLAGSVHAEEPSLQVSISSIIYPKTTPFASIGDCLLRAESVMNKLPSLSHVHISGQSVFAGANDPADYTVAVRCGEIKYHVVILVAAGPGTYHDGKGMTILNAIDTAWGS